MLNYYRFINILPHMRACARVYTYAHMYTHMLNKNDNPCEFVEKAGRSIENKQKSKKKAKCLWKISRRFPILKSQTNLGKKFKNKIGKVSRKISCSFPILFFEKILDKIYISFTSSYRILPYHHGWGSGSCILLSAASKAL